MTMELFMGWKFVVHMTYAMHQDLQNFFALGQVVGVKIIGMVNTCIYIVSRVFTSGGKFSMLLMNVSNNQFITFNFPFFDNLIFFHMFNIYIMILYFIPCSLGLMFCSNFGWLIFSSFYFNDFFQIFFVFQILFSSILLRFFFFFFSNLCT